MMKFLVILLITIIVFILTYYSCDENRGKKAFVASSLAAAISFISPYIIDWIFLEKEEMATKTEKEEDEDKNEKDDESNEVDNSDNENTPSPFSYMGETHTPSDVANKVQVSGDWIKDEDSDIAGQLYDDGIKVTIYNFFSSLDGNSSGISTEITSEIHYAINEQILENIPEEEQYLEGKFVVMKETDGSPSTAVISILLDGEEVYNSGEIDCYSLDIEPFNVQFSEKKEMIIKTVCQHKGNPFVFGIVNNE